MWRENQGGTAFGQLALRRLFVLPEYALGCPKLRPASANQPDGPRWPVRQALVSTWGKTTKAALPFWQTASNFSRWSIT